MSIIRQAGFTLIEILVVAAVIVILTGMGIASYRRFDGTRKVEAAAVGFGTMLRTTQKKADAGIRIDDCDPTRDLKGYQVKVPYSSYPVPMAEETVLCKDSPPVSLIHTLAHEATFMDDFKVQFNVIGGGVIIDNSAEGMTQIARYGTNTRYQVEVTSGGAITVEKI